MRYYVSFLLVICQLGLLYAQSEIESERKFNVEIVAGSKLNFLNFDYKTGNGEKRNSLVGPGLQVGSILSYKVIENISLTIGFMFSKSELKYEAISSIYILKSHEYRTNFSIPINLRYRIPVSFPIFAETGIIKAYLLDSKARISNVWTDGSTIFLTPKLDVESIRNKNDVLLNLGLGSMFFSKRILFKINYSIGLKDQVKIDLRFFHPFSVDYAYEEPPFKIKTLSVLIGYSF